MANAASSQIPTEPMQQSRDAARTGTVQQLKNLYLLAYNFVSAILWFSVLGRVATILLFAGQKQVFKGTDDFARYTQSLAILEVLHSLLGIVRAPLFTTAMQVASRFLLVWAVAYPFPNTVSASPAYSTMLIAWSVTEVIRYSFFSYQLSPVAVPDMLQWLRYNTFFVLYPLGITSECWLLWIAARGPAKANYGWGVEWMIYAILAAYVPGAYVLYTHMMKQRSRVMRGKGKVQ